MRIEKIVFAKCCDAALNGFDATQHRSGIKVLRAKSLSRAVDPFQPRQKREILPYGAQQNLIKMGMRIDEARHQNAAGAVYDFFGIVDRCRRVFANFRDDPLFDTDMGTEGLPSFRHWHNEGVRENHGT